MNLKVWASSLMKQAPNRLIMHPPNHRLPCPTTLFSSLGEQKHKEDSEKWFRVGWFAVKWESWKVQAHFSLPESSLPCMPLSKGWLGYKTLPLRDVKPLPRDQSIITIPRSSRLSQPKEWVESYGKPRHPWTACLWYHIPGKPPNMVKPFLVKHLLGDQPHSIQITCFTYNDLKGISPERKLIVHLTLTCPTMSLIMERH